MTICPRQSAKCHKSNNGWLDTYKTVMPYCQICRHTNVTHWPYAHDIWPRAANWTVCTFHDVQHKNCCHAKCYVSRNENVEQWPYDQRLTLASVVQNQCRVPWQPHYMSCSYTWLYSYVEARKRRSLTICPRNSVWVHHQSKVLAWWLK